MGGPQRVRVWGRLMLLAICIMASIASSARDVAGAAAASCFGDEQLLLTPADPHVGEPLAVAAISRFPHEHARFGGPAGPITAERQPIGDLQFWQVTVMPDQAGELQVTFDVTDGTDLVGICAVASTLVADARSDADRSGLLAQASPTSETLGISAVAAAAGPASDANTASPAEPAPASGAATSSNTSSSGSRTASRDSSTNDNHADNDNTGRSPTKTPTPRPTRTPTPVPAPTDTREPTPTREPTASREPTATRTPRPPEDPTNTPVPTASRTPEPTDTPRPANTPRPTDTPKPVPTDTPVPTPTPTLGPPSISGADPTPLRCKEVASIHGQNFGANQKAVDGDLVVDGLQTAISKWTSTDIYITVPSTARAGEDRLVQVTVNGKHTTLNLRITC